MKLSAKVYLAEERRQAATRIGIVAACLILLSALLLIRGEQFTPLRLSGLGAMAAYLLVSLAWLRWVVGRSDNWKPRALATLVTDMAVTTLALAMAGSLGSFFYPVFLWVVVGYGLRYGSRYLLLASLEGFAGFALVLAFGSYWGQHLDVGLGLLGGILILPIFFLSVLKRLSRLNERLGEELVKAQSAEKAKGDFLASMSHEIRTPLNGVIGMAQMLEEAPLDAEHRSYVDVIIRSGESLLAVINDVLDFSKIQSGQLRLEEVPFNLKTLMTDLVQLLGLSAAKQGLRLELAYDESLPLRYRGDPVRLKQILTNLVGNGIKFTREGQVRLEAKLEKRTDQADRIVLEVTDTGIGIPDDRIEAIFDPFEQADCSTTRKYGGTGLGLSISRQLAHQMGGRLTVDSVPGQGTTFSLRLELPRVEEQPEPERRSRGAASFGLHALLVEDQRVNQLVARRLMAKLGITCDIAENGVEAIEKVDPRRHQIVFMDLHMPVMNGWDATARIRAHGGAHAKVPIIALTADADVETAQRARAEGMNAHLSKPLRIAEIVRALHELGLGSDTADADLVTAPVGPGPEDATAPAPVGNRP